MFRLILLTQGQCCNSTTMSDSTTSSIASRSDQMSIDDQPFQVNDDDKQRSIAPDTDFIDLSSPAPTKSINSESNISSVDTTPKLKDTSRNFASRATATTNAVKKSTTSTISLRKATVTARANASRKQHLNESNLALKKHELLHAKRSSPTSTVHSSSTGGVVAQKSCAGKSRVFGAATQKLPAASLIDDIPAASVPTPAVVVVGGSAATTQGSAVVTTPTGGSSVATRKCTAVTPNKWDAVMNKIAVNKSAGKTRDYSAVKSKVTCGLVSKRGTPGQLQSPSSATDQIVASPQEQRQQHQLFMTNQVLAGKRLFAVNAKR